MRMAAWLLLGIALVWSGCASLRTSRPELPARNAVRLDQLVIHSNFELPKQHRLLEEVDALRWDVIAKLGLTAVRRADPCLSVRERRAIQGVYS